MELDHKWNGINVFEQNYSLNFDAHSTENHRIYDVQIN